MNASNRLKIEYVTDTVSGEILDSSKAIGDDLVEIGKLRKELRLKLNDNPKYICSICQTPVYLVSSILKRDFFRHKHEDGNCPALTRTGLTRDQTLAAIYNGLQETEKHKHIKAILADSLTSDNRFKNIKIEKVIKNFDRTSWRKPDVSATYNGNLIAFEIQLATTLLDIIIAREKFYRSISGFIFWVFSDFQSYNDRLSKLDIFHNNNCNAFIINNYTHSLSKSSKTFHLLCQWLNPYSKKVNSKTVKIDEIQLNYKNQTAYYYNYEEHKKQLGRKIKLESLLCHIEKNAKSRDTDIIDYDNIRKEMLTMGIKIPNDNSRVLYLARLLLSAKYGYPFGYNINLTGLYHQTYNYKKSKNKDGWSSLLILYQAALDIYNRIDFESINRGDLLKKKMNEVITSVKIHGTSSLFWPKKDDVTFAQLFVPTIIDQLSTYGVYKSS